MDLFPASYRSESFIPRQQHGPGVVVGQGPAVVDEIFDYDGLNLGLDYDFAVRQGVALPGIDKVVPGGVVRGRPGVVGPVLETRPVVVSNHAIGRRPPHVAKVHSPRRRASLWRKLHYLEYLRHLYRKNYNEYYHEYYGTGANAYLAKLTKKEE